MRLDLGSLHTYARGCGILGTGGGGDIHIPLLAARAAIEANGPVDVVDLDGLPDDALVLPVSGWGAPTVSIEKFESGDEGRALVDAAQRWFGRPITALMVSEIGGGNGVVPVAWAAELGLPLVDADGMGRAFPEGDMTTLHLAGVPASPAFFADERGNAITAMPRDAAWLERIARHLVVAFGGSVAGADHVLEAATARTAAVRGSLHLAFDLGAALAADGVEGVLRVSGGERLGTGTVTDVARRTEGGFARGTVRVDDLVVHIQNENLVAERDGRAVATVPDLITIVDQTTGDAIATERLRYGQRVEVIGIPCAELWRTPEGIRLAGPARFGYDHPYRPLGSP
jgi:hypothetical protein